jgi:shikimate dehydrogenase
VKSSALGKPKACIVGWPVAHSRSPLIHRFWLEHLKIEGSYELAAVPPAGFPAFARDLARQGFVGANVTLPHKQTAFELCDFRTETAACLRVVNTLWIEAGKLCGDNTDAGGFADALDQDAPGWDINSRKAVVIGAGGAARAIVYALKLRGTKRIFLINRTKERAAELALEFGAPIEVVDFPDLPGTLTGADLLINTTSLGMRGQPPLAIDLRSLPPDAVVSDIVYVPLETTLLRAAKARGLRTVSGIGMLLHQAVPGFERWFGRKPCVTPELRNLVEADIAAGYDVRSGPHGVDRHGEIDRRRDVSRRRSPGPRCRRRGPHALSW